MKHVSRFEANLLRILHCFLRRVPVEQTLPVLLSPCARPQGLGRAALDLIQDSLAKGCVVLLARSGGWRREGHLRAVPEGSITGRLWQRTPPGELGLVFSRHSLEFLIGITSGQATEPVAVSFQRTEELTPADWLLFFCAYGVLRDTEAFPAARAQAIFAGNALCQLAHSEDFADLAFDFSPDFEVWISGVGGCILEALQPELARKWLRAERLKRQISDWQMMRTLGRAQHQVLEPFCKAIESADRMDLARFLFQTVFQLLSEAPKGRNWVGQVDFSGARIADRTATHEAALVLPRRLEHLRRWERRARRVGYFDEGYAAAQMTRSEWERWHGNELCSRAAAIQRELEPLQ